MWHCTTISVNELKLLDRGSDSVQKWGGHGDQRGQWQNRQSRYSHGFTHRFSAHTLERIGSRPVVDEWTGESTRVLSSQREMNDKKGMWYGVRFVEEGVKSVEECGAGV